MSAVHIHPRFRTISASLLLDTLGGSLARIKREDDATDADLGAVLGKSADRAEAYRKGLGDMGVVSFLRGCREWDGRFADDALGLIGMRLVPADAGEGCDRSGLTALAVLLAQLTAALEDDSAIDERELAAMRGAIDRAGREIDRLRDRLRPRAIGG